VCSSDLRYLSNIAFWLARGSRGVEYQLLSSGREEIATIGRGERSKGYQFSVDRPTTITFILHWEGQATLGLSVRSPDGAVACRDHSASSPLRATFPAETLGTWTAEVEGIDVPAARAPYVLTLINEKAEPVAPATPPVVMPFYLVCDVSATDAAMIANINTLLRHVQRALAADSGLDAVVRLSVIAFDGTGRTVVPLAAPSAINLPTLQAGQGRSYGAALREYHRVFEQDRTRLKAGGTRVFRPCVLFLTHGEPDDADYATTLRSVLGYDPVSRYGNPAYPNLIPIGLPGASRQAVSGLAYPDFGDLEKRGRWLQTPSSFTSAEAFRATVETINQIIADSYATTSQGAPEFVPPASIGGALAGIAGRDA